MADEVRKKRTSILRVRQEEVFEFTEETTRRRVSFQNVKHVKEYDKEDGKIIDMSPIREKITDTISSDGVLTPGRPFSAASNNSDAREVTENIVHVANDFANATINGMSETLRMVRGELPNESVLNGSMDMDITMQPTEETMFKTMDLFAPRTPERRYSETETFCRTMDLFGQQTPNKEHDIREDVSMAISPQPPAELDTICLFNSVKTPTNQPEDMDISSLSTPRRSARIASSPARSFLSPGRTNRSPGRRNGSKSPARTNLSPGRHNITQTKMVQTIPEEENGAEEMDVSAHSEGQATLQLFRPEHLVSRNADSIRENSDPIDGDSTLRDSEAMDEPPAESNVSSSSLSTKSMESMGERSEDNFKRPYIFSSTPVRSDVSTDRRRFSTISAINAESPRNRSWTTEASMTIDREMTLETETARKEATFTTKTPCFDFQQEHTLKLQNSFQRRRMDATLSQQSIHSPRRDIFSSDKPARASPLLKHMVGNTTSSDPTSSPHSTFNGSSLSSSSSTFIAPPNSVDPLISEVFYLTSEASETEEVARLRDRGREILAAALLESTARHEKELEIAYSKMEKSLSRDKLKIYKEGNLAKMNADEKELTAAGFVYADNVILKIRAESAKNFLPFIKSEIGEKKKSLEKKKMDAEAVSFLPDLEADVERLEKQLSSFDGFDVNVVKRTLANRPKVELQIDIERNRVLEEMLEEAEISKLRAKEEMEGAYRILELLRTYNMEIVARHERIQREKQLILNQEDGLVLPSTSNDKTLQE